MDNKMKNKSLSLILLTLSTNVSSSGEQPTPVVEYNSISTGYQTVTVDDVEVGVGSPIPVHVIVPGNLPDPCSQVKYAEFTRSDFANKISSTSSR